MCGRIFQTHAINTLLRLAKTNRVKNTYNFNPTYNQGPTNYIAAIRAADDDDQWDEQQLEDEPHQSQENQDSHQPEQDQFQQQEPIEPPVQSPKKGVKRGLDFMKWGYQTSFSLIINARVEEMHEKNFFKPFLNTRRCVVLAEGYYEWNPKKEPFVFQRNDKKPLLMAAMYTENEEVFVLTRDSFGDFERVHHRMPVLLEEDEVDLWINTKNSFQEIINQKILNQQKKIWGMVTSYQAAPHVNNMKEKGEKCLMSLKEYKETQYQKGLGRFFQKKEKGTEEKNTPKNEQQNVSTQKTQDTEFDVIQ